VKSANNLYYVGGEMTFFITEECHNPDNQEAYHLYFGCHTGVLDKGWTLHLCCNTYAANRQS
jgi:hypothetical protein